MNSTFQGRADVRRSQPRWQHMARIAKRLVGDFGKPLKVLHDVAVQFPCCDPETIGEIEQAR
jgi:hypothetical protein